MPETRTYRRSDVVSFRKTREAFGGLSNMARDFPLRVADVPVRTSEALYQCCRFPHLPDVQRRILDEVSPMTAKMRGKPFLADTRPGWDELRVPIMKWCLRVKLAQHWRAFGDLLRETAGRPIVEDSRRDRFWGAVPSDDDAMLEGCNVLGRLLMELRAALLERPETLHHVAAPRIERFTLLDRPIPIIRAVAEGEAERELASPARLFG